jgi:multiple sugar transport system ATP-binding protein
MASLELTSIAKTYGAVEVMRGLDLKVQDGAFCALLGPSGCGKSTLLRMIAGLETVTAGNIRIDSTDVTHEQPSKRGVAMVFQNYALYPHLTVRQNIAFSLSLAGVSKAVQAEKADVVAKMLQLEPLMERRPAELSGGQRQRVAIGRALVRDPKVFLFDEPLSNLDALLRVQMRLELAKLHQDLKTTMVYVTHDQVEAMTLADQIVVLDKGVVQQVGSPLDLYNAPANRFVAGFIGSPAMNFLPVTVDGGDLVLAGGGRLPAGTKGAVVEVGIRPEHMRIVAAGAGVVQGTTRVVEQLGNTSFVYIDGPAGTMVVEVAPEATPAPGQNVELALDPTRLHKFSGSGARLTN